MGLGKFAFGFGELALPVGKRLERVPAVQLVHDLPDGRGVFPQVLGGEHLCGGLFGLLELFQQGVQGACGSFPQVLEGTYVIG